MPPTKTWKRNGSKVESKVMNCIFCVLLSTCRWPAHVYRTSNTWYGFYLRLVCAGGLVGGETPWWRGDRIPASKFGGPTGGLNVLPRAWIIIGILQYIIIMHCSLLPRNFLRLLENLSYYSVN